MIFRILLAALLLTGATQCIGQVNSIDLNKEKEFYLATKQINQFFRRFNNEESPKGERYYEGNPLFRESEIRKKFLDMLFDNQDPRLNRTSKTEFISQVTAKQNQKFIEFHDHGWFAEVSTSFLWQDKPEPFTLFLQLQEESVGSKWVITNIYNEKLYALLGHDTAVWNKFIHPMSHELEFMNLSRVFQDMNLAPYLERGFQPDYMSIFIYEYKKGNLKFTSVNNVKFHFMQIPGWYFELRNFNRSGINSGWLVSRLQKVPEEDKSSFLKLIFNDKD